MKRTGDFRPVPADEIVPKKGIFKRLHIQAHVFRKIGFHCCVRNVLIGEKTEKIERLTVK